MNDMTDGARVKKASVEVNKLSKRLHRQVTGARQGGPDEGVLGREVAGNEVDFHLVKRGERF